MPRVPLFWRALSAFLVLPGMIAFVIPWTMHPQHMSPRPAGWPVFALGVFILLWCVRDFYVVGKGSLAPWSPPEQLVTVGLYRYARNPMYVGVLLILLGWALLYRTRALWIYFGAIAIMFHLRVIMNEEPFLARTHGAAWSEYRAKVRRWLVV